MPTTVLAFDLAYRSTGWAQVTYEGPNSWTVERSGIIRGRPVSASPVTDYVRVLWAGSALKQFVDVINTAARPEVTEGIGHIDLHPLCAIVYESGAAWLLAKARSQHYQRMRKKTNREAILAFGAARERLYQAIASAPGVSDIIEDLPIIAVDPRKWQRILDRVILGDVTRKDKKAQTRSAVRQLTGMPLKVKGEFNVTQDEVDAIGLGLWASEAFDRGKLSASPYLPE